MQPIVKSLVIAAFALATACTGYQEGSSSRTPGEYIDDVAIQGQVKTLLLREPGVDGLSINTEVRQGIVTLYGHVKSEAQRQQVLTAVRATSGVKGVDDRLVIVE
jgi:osmotically-inducible protein OsmY